MWTFFAMKWSHFTCDFKYFHALKYYCIELQIMSNIIPHRCIKHLLILCVSYVGKKNKFMYEHILGHVEKAEKVGHVLTKVIVI